MHSLDAVDLVVLARGVMRRLRGLQRHHDLRLRVLPESCHFGGWGLFVGHAREYH